MIYLLLYSKKIINTRVRQKICALSQSKKNRNFLTSYHQQERDVLFNRMLNGRG